MIFERKVFIEFVDRNRIKVTTPYKQNFFDLKKNGTKIDLIDLKESKLSGKFYALVDAWRQEPEDEPYFSLQIFANEHRIREVHFGDVDCCVKCKILEND